MRFGIFTDVHSNLEALEAVLAAMAEADGYLCLGDLVGYGPDPNQCIERIAALPNLTAVVGNHDQAALSGEGIEWFNPHAAYAARWTGQALTAASRQFLGKLRETEIIDEITLVHGSLPDPMEYITSPYDAQPTFEMMATPICLIGHSHVAEYYRAREDSRFAAQVSLFNGGEIEIEPGYRYIINVGGVGQPRDGNPRAAYGIYDTDRRLVTAARVEYPIAETQAKMEAAGLPTLLIQRLEVGR
jgi:diadenosine tetraphosphatase ApaH/serine/threonine PP2A family protein phosphatase